MSDLKFEQKRSLSRLEAADQLTALATALRKGGEVDLELGAGTLTLRIPDDLRSEIEIEIGDGEIELEIEFKWPTSRSRKAPSQVAAAPAKAPRRKTTPTAKAGPSSTATGGKNAKRPAPKTP
ncbi:amphi-Trp domain-containing protein [Streptomyces sp. NPDC054952]